ncbi:hypothetical protein [Mycobacterium sp. Aquia_213]|uniref:hypothetical protein n=1 Tax=Mycobacterium sp. Aquia_213 TaxID=2991728 RepID=UPI00226E850D|nr:hypothetical protein [Mycobacterium sp. Aquia_213]WAC90165.1 hypothetical protein LMQ14_19850 [Mycobacterium sp. Aquia_213]
MHRFYQPASDLTESELLVHRRAVKVADPSLPQRAGRAYARFSRGDTMLVGGNQGIIVRSVVRPEPDLRLLVKAAIAIAKKDLDDEDRRAA